jgi:hypothetical protein
MPRFDIDSYEPVEERITKFYAIHPAGSILTELNKHTDDFSKVVFMAVCYNADGTPLATGWAMEEQGKGMVNNTSHLENCETSAIGRALANMGLHGSKRPSREEMQKVERVEQQEAPTSEEQRVRSVYGKALAELKQKDVDATIIDGYNEEAKRLFADKKLGAIEALAKKMVDEANLETF